MCPLKQQFSEGQEVYRRLMSEKEKKEDNPRLRGE
jgi:hypothetical protein